MKQWLLLENNPAFSHSDFFPPGDAWAELAHLRAEHERLLSIAAEEVNAYSDVQKRYEAEDAARSTELSASFLSGGKLSKDGRATEAQRHDELADARLRAEAAYDALVKFLTEAIAEVKRRAPEFYAQLEPSYAVAQQKREEAQRLLDEANAQVAQVRKFQNWLDRFSGRSKLPLYSYEQMPASADAPATLINVA